MKIIIAFLITYVLYIIQKKILLRNWHKNLEVNVNFLEAHVSEGEQTRLVETIVNNKRLPIPFLNIKFTTSKYLLFDKEKNTAVTDYFYRHDIYTIGSYEKITRLYPFICSRRGAYTISFIDVLSMDLFFSEIDHIPANTNTILFVKPKILPVKELPLELVNAIKTVILHVRTLEDPFEFKGIREYQPYDNIRYINWKVTAKLGNLQVNTHFSTTSRQVNIFLDLETHVIAHEETMKEACIQLAYTIASMFSEQGIPFQLTSNGLDKFTKERVNMASGCGPQHLTQLGIALSRIDVTKACPDIKPILSDFVKKESTNQQLILISNNRKPELVKLYEEELCPKANCLYALPEFSDVELGELHVTNLYVWEVDYSDTIQVF